MHIAFAAGSTVRNRRALAREHEVRERRARLLVEDNRARRHAHDEVVALMAVLLLAAAGLAVARDETRRVFEIEQGGEALVHFENNVAAAAAITARRSAEGPELFAQKCDRAVTAFAGLYIDSGFVDKPHVRVEL